MGHDHTTKADAVPIVSFQSNIKINELCLRVLQPSAQVDYQISDIFSAVYWHILSRVPGSNFFLALGADICPSKQAIPKYSYDAVVEPGFLLCCEDNPYQMILSNWGDIYSTICFGSLNGFIDRIDWW